MISRSKLALFAAVFASVASTTHAQSKAPRSCPEAVVAGVEKAYAGATIQACHKEVEDGKTQYETQVTTKDGEHLTMDIDPAGAVLQTEVVVPVDALPEPVKTAFAKKYPGAKAARAEKATKSDGSTSYEIAFTAGKARKEATFAADGSFVEEE